MREERSNKEPWVSRLDSLSSTSLDKAAAWDKLQERLAEKKNSKKLFWLAIPTAAAILLFFFLLTNRRETGKGPLEIPIVSKPVTHPGNISNFTNDPVLTKTNPTTINTNTKQVQAPVTKKMEIVTGDSPDSSIVIVTHEPDTVSIPEIKPAVVFKKKRVVHLNELQNQPPVPYADNGSAKTKPFPFQKILRPGQTLEEFNTETNPQNLTPKRSVLPFSGLSQKN